ncbi:MAG: DinB family protein [Gemmatimonadales bacterium]
MNEAERIAEELSQGYDGTPWHGASLAEILEPVDAMIAAARPISHAHTIWELVLHLTGWTSEVTSRLEGNTSGLPPEGDWPDMPPPTPAAWLDALDRLRDARRKLDAAIRAFPPAKLNEIVEPGPMEESAVRFTFRTMLHGVAQHDSYHAGQISLLRKAAQRPINNYP